MRSLSLFSRMFPIGVSCKRGIFPSIFAYTVFLFPLFPTTQNAQDKPQVESVKADSKSRTDNLTISRVFHVAGIPKTSRNTRGDLIFTQDEMIFRRGKSDLLRVSFKNMRRVQLFDGARDNAVTAVTMAGLTYGIGGLLMAKQTKVDALVFDYVNENGGLMGLAIQVPKDQGKRCQEWLARFGVK